MAAQAGIVQTLQGGKFFVKDELGNIKELKQGDIINENDTVYGDSSNSSSSKIEILLDGNDVIVLMQGQQQLIDSSLIETAFGSEELFFTRGDLEQILEAHRAMTDIESDLRAAKFKGDKNITEEETTEGKEEVEDEESSASQFAARTGAMTDIESDLRKKLFSSSINLRKEENALGNDFKLPKSQSYNEAQNNFNNQTNNNKPLGERPSNPFEKPTYPTTPPTRPNTDKPTEEPDRPTSEVRPDEPKPDVKPPVTPPPAPESAAKLSIDDQIIWEQDGKMWFTVTLDKPLSGDVTFTYKTSSGTATEGKDYIGKTGTITIPAGSTSVKIPVDILDDFFYEKSEYFNIDITNITGNINKNDSKTHGTGTILDNPPVKDSPITPNSPDSSTGSYGEEDTVYAIITGDPTVKEGDKSGYIVKLVDKDGNPVIVDKNTDVTVVYKNITTQDNDTQYKNGDKITITIPKGSNQATFTVETKDDFYADNGEKFNLSIEKVDTNEFENVVIGDKYGNNKDVTTEILDNTTTNPNNPSTVEPNQESVILKIVACDESGNPIIVNGKYVFANEVPEGSDAKYKVLAFAPNTTEFKTTDKLDIQGGKVTIKTENGSANGVNNQTKIDGSEDYKTTQIEVDLDSVISVETFDDYLKDGGETFNVVIVNNSYKHPTTPVYENVKTDTKPVTTTITDNPSKINQADTSTTPDDKTAGTYDQTDTVYAVITGTQTIKEGDLSTVYTVKLVDKNGNVVTPTKDTKITVTYNNISTQDDDTQYKDGDKIEVTILANTQEITFTVKTNDDVYKDNNEQFKLTITDIANTGEFENVKIGDKDGSKKDVISTIIDNTNPNTETNGNDDVKIVLVALEKGQTLADITDSNGKLIYKNTNTTPESGKLYYVAVAVDKDDKVLVQSGQVTVNTANGSATGHNNPTKIDGSEDYKSLVNKPINIGEVFEVETNDDYLREDSEAFTVKITDVVNTNYETPTIDTTKDTVTSTITDNPAKVEQPDTGTGEDNPTTGNYGKEDTVYVKISGTPSVDEGGNLVHTVTLVDKAGNPVTVPSGQSVTVNLTYSANSGDFTESDLSTIVKQVVITGGSNSATFTNTSVIDNKVEGTEIYNVTIGSVTQSGAFENVAIHTDKTTTGTITDNAVRIVLVATDKDGNIPLDSDGKVDLSKNTNSTPEGGKLYYVAVAIDKDGKPLDKQEGKVDVSYGATPDNGTTDDYTKQTGKETQVTIGEVFEVTAKDDYFAEGNENFDVVISNPTNTPYVTPSIVQDKVTSTITDNPANKDTSTPTTPTEPTSPTDSTGKYGEEDTVYVVITGDQSKLEGEELLHNLKLVDKDGNEVKVPAGEKITVTLKYTSDAKLESTDFKTGENQYNKNGTITVELDSNGKATIKNKSEIDAFVEGSEKYTLSIDKITQTVGKFENIQAGYSGSYKTANPSLGNGTSVTGEIKDNAVKIVLVAVTKDDINTDGTVKKENIIKADGTVDLDKNTNSTPEGGKLYYVAVAVDSNNKPLDVQAGNVTVSYGNTSITTDKDATLTGGTSSNPVDIANNPATVKIGEVFTVDAVDDYYAEGDEKFEVTISTPDSTAQTTYGNSVSVDTSKNTVTSTITDNPSKINQGTNTGNDDPTNGNYGEDDTVYAVITGTQTIKEGDLSTVYTVKLVDKNGNVVTPTKDTKITVTYNNISTQDDDTQYKDGDKIEVTILANTQEITFTVKTNDDYFADSNEQFKLTITDVANTGEFENVKFDFYPNTISGATNNVTTTIVDNTTTNPNNSSTVEPNQESVILKIVALDKDGNFIMGGADNKYYTFANEVPEGSNAKYMVLAFKPETTEFTTDNVLPNDKQGGTVTISTTDDTAKTTGTKDNAELDYDKQTGKLVTVGTAFDIKTLDDYLSDNNETFKVSIDNNSYTHPVAGAIYENVKTDSNPVTTTIKDNTTSTPNTDSSTENTDNGNPAVEKVILKIFAADKNGNPIKDGSGNYKTANEVPEGSDAYYVVLAFKPDTTTFNDSTKLTIQGGSVEVQTADKTAKGASSQTADDGSQDYISKTEVVELGKPISVKTLDDWKADNDEQFEIKITPNTYQHPKDAGVDKPVYENVTTDTNPVTTTIKDNTTTYPNSDSSTEKDPTNPAQNHIEKVILKIVACDESGNPIIVDGKYTFANSTPEGSVAKYKVLAFHPNTTEFKTTDVLAEQGGTVTVSTADISGGAVGISVAQSTFNGTQDYTSQSTVVVTVGTTIFEVQTLDDYKAETETNETFKVNIDTSSYKHPDNDVTKAIYENVTIDNAGVTTTIIDNDAAKNQTLGTNGADTNKNTYGEEDTVWAVITADKTSVVEGNKVTYTVKLVDKNNNPVTVSSDTTVKIKFAGVTGSEAELNDLLKIFSGDSSSTTEISGGFDSTNKELTITIPNGSSQTQFTIQTKDDFTTEGDQKFDLSISDINSSEFENLVFDRVKGGAEGSNKTTTTIKDGVSFGTPTNAYVDEDNFDVLNPNNPIKDNDGKTGHVDGKLNLITNGETDFILSFQNDGATIPSPIVNVYKGDASSNDSYSGLTSGGETILYKLDGADKIVGYYTKSGSEVKVFEVTLDKTSGKYTGDYTYTQYKNIDHPVNSTTNPSGDITVWDDNITFEFGFNITDQGSTSTTPQKFKVTVNDSLPKAGDLTAIVVEDSTAATPANKIVISPESFKGGYIGIKNTENGTVQYLANTAGTVDGKTTVTSVDILDPNDSNKVIGTLTTSGDGTVVFVPKPDYSNYADKPKFWYEVSDFDGDTANGKVEITVKPVADAPTIFVKDVTTYEDSSDNTQANGNKAEGTNKVNLELKVPYLSKDSDRLADTTVTPNIVAGTGDQNGDKTGDNPERNGEITLKFTNGLAVTGAKIFSGSTEVATISSNNQELKIVIVTETGGDASKIDYTYHHKGTLPAKGGNVLYLTKAEYEALQIQHAEDNDTDIKITIGVTSYEVDDSGKPLNASDSTYTDQTNTDLSKTTTAEMTVKIKAVTDDITLNWDSSKIASVGTLDGTSKVLTFNPITENNSNPKTGETKTENVLDFGTLLTNTSGTKKDPFTDNPKGGDLDGSEHRSYTISLTEKNGGKLPDFIYVTIGTTQKEVKVNKDSSGNYKLDFDSTNNKLENPDFKIKFPDYWSGDVTGTITLRTKDYGVDNDADTTNYTSSGGEADGVKKAEVKFEVKVNPVANLATIEVEQAIGYEDAGRAGGNTTDKNGTITNPEKGIPLNIKVTSDDKDGSETFDVTISNLPNNGSLYVKDPITNEYVLITYNNTGVPTINLWNSGTLTTYSSGNILVGNNTVSIKSLTNAKQPDIKFIPAHNDDTDFIGSNGFKVSATTTDGSSTINSAEVTIDVIVKNKADAPVGTELTTDGSKLITVGDNSYIKATEEQNINLKDIYKKPDDLASYDDSEELTIKIELPTGFTIKEGSPYEIIDVKYVVKASDIKDGNIKIVPPLNFSGAAEIKLTYVTTEKAGENDSKTWNTQTVNIFVNPQADDVNVANSSTIYEDGLDVNGNALNTKVDLSATLKDTDGKGVETIDAVYVSVASITELTSKGYTVTIGTDNITSKTTANITPKGGSAKDYYVLTNEQAAQIKVVNTDPHKIDDSQTKFDLDVAYKVTDTVSGVSHTETYGHTHTVNVVAVTDKPTLNVGLSDVTGNVIIGGTTEKPTASIGSANSTFKVNMTTTSGDKDLSEKVVEIVISGVPQGVEVEGATYKGYSGSEHNGIWVLNPNSSVDSTNSVTFKVNKGSANFENRDIKITTYTQDKATTGTLVESDTKTINITKTYEKTEGATGNPAEFNLIDKHPGIFEDNDSDPQTSGNQNEKNLGDFIGVTNDGGATSGNYAITISGLGDTKLVGADYSYVKDGETFYVVTGTGSASDIEEKLSNIKIELPKDMNTGGDKNGQFTFDATISTWDGAKYHDGVGIKDYKEDITPVTDKMTIKVEATGTLKEDTPVDLKITLSNPSDATKTELIGNSLTIKINETWKDDATGGVGTKGTLTGDNYNIVESPDGTYTITKKDGTAFTVDTPITGLVYTPATNRDGDVKFEVSVQNKEGDSITLTSKGEANITVKPVIDFVLNNTTVVTNGKEDVDVTIGGTTLANSMKLEFGAGTMTDSSESFGSIVLDKIPNGFTVWYKDGTELKMATNIGQSGNGFVLNPNITPAETTHYNQWLVPQIGTGNALPEIYINAPTNWAGEFKFDATFKVKEQQGSFETHNVQDITGKITPVADGVTIAPTLTFGDAFSWLDLKLNANMKDVDGSEVMNLELTGLSANSQFKIEGGAVLSGTQAVWDATNSKWTITGIKFDEINKIQFTSDKDVTSVGVNAWTQEIKADGTNVTGTDATSSKINGNFNVDVKEISGNFTLDKGIDLDFSKLDKLNIKNITSIDLGVSNGKNELLNLKLSDVLAMTNSSKELIIKGDNQDKVSFKNDGNTWSKGSTETIGGKTFDIYSNSSDSSVKVKVENNINDQII